jgi:hypothetical protein
VAHILKKNRWSCHVSQFRHSWGSVRVRLLSFRHKRIAEESSFLKALCVEDCNVQVDALENHFKIMSDMNIVLTISPAARKSNECAVCQRRRRHDAVPVAGGGGEGTVVGEELLARARDQREKPLDQG